MGLAFSSGNTIRNWLPGVAGTQPRLCSGFGGSVNRGGLHRPPFFFSHRQFPLPLRKVPHCRCALVRSAAGRRRRPLAGRTHRARQRSRIRAETPPLGPDLCSGLRRHPGAKKMSRRWGCRRLGRGSRRELNGSSIFPTAPRWPLGPGRLCRFRADDVQQQQHHHAQKQ